LTSITSESTLATQLTIAHQCLLYGTTSSILYKDNHTLSEQSAVCS